MLWDLSADGKWVATVSTNNVIQVWDWQQGKLVHEFSVPTNFPAVPDAFLDQDKTLVITMPGTTTWKNGTSFPGKNSLLAGIRNWYYDRISPNGQYCVTWRDDDAALLRNLSDGHESNLNLDAKQQASDLCFFAGRKVAGGRKHVWICQIV